MIVVDGESKEVKYVRTFKRIPEEQRWDPNNLEWITVVPWNRGGDGVKKGGGGKGRGKKGVEKREWKKGSGKKKVEKGKWKKEKVEKGKWKKGKG